MLSAQRCAQSSYSDISFLPFFLSLSLRLFLVCEFIAKLRCQRVRTAPANRRMPRTAVNSKKIAIYESELALQWVGPKCLGQTDGQTDSDGRLRNSTAAYLYKTFDSYLIGTAR